MTLSVMLKISVSPQRTRREKETDRRVKTSLVPQTLLLSSAHCVKQVTAVGWEAWTHDAFTGCSEALTEPIQGEIHQN